LDEEQEIPFGLCLWATGVGMRPFTRTVQQKLGSVQEKHRTLVTDPQLRVRGTPNNTVYAIGDCATIENPRLLDHIQNFFKEADTNKNGTLDLNEFESLCEQLIVRYPQTEEHLNKMNELFETFDVDRSGELSLDELEAMFKTIDRNMTTLPAVSK
jgi:NADH dehydrogenase